jgi:hypothetical protein
MNGTDTIAAKKNKLHRNLRITYSSLKQEQGPQGQKKTQHSPAA